MDNKLLILLLSIVLIAYGGFKLIETINSQAWLDALSGAIFIMLGTWNLYNYFYRKHKK